ncbi:hypothetical protein ACFLQU_03370 [Verrucomicrobiota bacterium]
MPIEIEDPEEEKKAKAEERKKKRKAAAAAAAAEEDGELAGQKRELWPLIPAIPVVIAIVLSLIPEKPDVDERDMVRSQCMGQLKIITSMKQDIAKDEKLEEGDEISDDAKASIKKSAACPAGGTIEIREVLYEPRCAMHGTMSQWLKEQENMAHWHEATSR